MVERYACPWLQRERPALIGMIHLAPLPGTPQSVLPFGEIRRRAMLEAELLVASGFDALLVENMGDTPYLPRHVGPEIIAAMTAVTADIVSLGVPVGVQVLAGANHAALSVATAAEAQFIRAEGFVFSHVADEGWMNGDAGTLLRSRREIQSDVAVFCDVQKKHSAHAVTADLSLQEWVDGALFCGADGVVVTGRTTGHAPDQATLTALATTPCPVLIGSGVTPENVADYAPFANGVIVGSYLKEEGYWKKPVCSLRARRMRDSVNELPPNLTP
ncbi:MAG: BtpA/SgcQ family protein [Bradymonadia bacterium]